ncbi:MAG: MFS transporter [Pseudomonadota bacterium]
MKGELTGSRSQGLAGATLAFFLGLAAVALYGPTAVELRESMGMSGFFMGLLIGAPQLTGSLLRIPFGAWVDEVGGRLPMLMLLTLSAVGLMGFTALMFAFYPNHLGPELYPMVLVCGLLSGCGIATFSVGVPQTAYWYAQREQGRALGIFAGLGNTAPGLFAIVLPVALGFLALPGAYAACLVFLMWGIALYAVLAQDAYYFQLRQRGVPAEEAVEVAREAGQELFPPGNAKAALSRSARNPHTWALVGLYFTSFGGFLALSGWFPSYWREFQGFDTRTAVILGGVGFSLLASIVTVFAGSMSDRFGGERMSLLGFSLVLGGAMGLMSAGNFPVALLCEMLIAAGMGVANAAVFKMAAKYVPDAVGGAAGWVGGLGAFGGFAVPPILGLFVDALGKSGYATGFAVYVVLALISLAITWRLLGRTVAIREGVRETAVEPA